MACKHTDSKSSCSKASISSGTTLSSLLCSGRSLSRRFEHAFRTTKSGASGDLVTRSQLVAPWAQRVASLNSDLVTISDAAGCFLPWLQTKIADFILKNSNASGVCFWKCWSHNVKLVRVLNVLNFWTSLLSRDDDSPELGLQTLSVWCPTSKTVIWSWFLKCMKRFYY